MLIEEQIGLWTLHLYAFYALMACAVDLRRKDDIFINIQHELGYVVAGFYDNNGAFYMSLLVLIITCCAVVYVILLYKF